MTVGLIECFAGISGDMLLGALLDAGVPESLLQTAAQSLGIGASLRVRRVDRSGIQASKVDVLEDGHIADQPHTHDHAEDHHHPHDHPHPHTHDHPPLAAEHQHDAHEHSRHWPEIRALITAAPLAEDAKKIALRAFELLAHAEARVHGIAPEDVHFHEVGAVDTIVDIVCAAAGAASLGVSEWRCTAVNTGSGYVQCAHGRMPVPAPATAELLKGLPTYAAGPAMELTTPTGAAMLRALHCRFDAAGPLVIDANGYGAGNRNPGGFPNVLRLSLGKPATAAASVPTQPAIQPAFRTNPARTFPGDQILVLECAIDDASPQVLAHAMDLALEHGALDVLAAPVTMKKGRLGTLLTVLCRSGEEAALEQLLFRETTTIGIRRREEERVILDRDWVAVDTRYGQIRVKVASSAGEVLNAMPEYEDCRRAAREHDAPLAQVMEAARQAWSATHGAKA